MSDETYTVVCDNILHKRTVVELGGEEHVVEFEKDKERGVAVATGVPAKVASTLAEDEAYSIGGPDGSSEEPATDTPSAIDGIGPTYEEILAEAGVDTLEALAEAEPEALAEQTGVSEETVTDWIEAAEAHG
jgi:predicted flap endonuclease-1-like 5' DNA nuclease